MDILAPRHRLGGYVEFPAPAGLATVVECVWAHVVPQDSPATLDTHRVVPDAGLSLCVTGRRVSGTLTRVQVRVIGPVTRWRPYPFEPGAEQVAMRLLPEWTVPLLGLRAWDIADDQPVLTDAGSIARLIDQSRVGRSWRDTLGTLLDHLHRQLRVAASPSEHLGFALAMFRHVRGPVAAVADRLGWSERHLRRLTRDGLGAAPKTYARLARFAGMVVASDRGDMPWAQLAVRSGFADQAHLVRETVELAGCTPSVLAAERRRQDAVWAGAETGLSWRESAPGGAAWRAGSTQRAPMARAAIT